MSEVLIIKGINVPITSGLNPSITKRIKDISEPDKAKATYSKSVVIPRSKEADYVFSFLFEFNITDHTFNVNSKADCQYIVDSEKIIDGYIRLTEIVEVDNNDIAYECVMYDATARFFSIIKDAYMTELYESTADYEGLDIYDHVLSMELQQLSWDTSIIENGVLVPFAFGKGYVYPLIDFGLSTDATIFASNQMPPAIYEREYMQRIIAWAGFTIQPGGYFDTDTWLDHLIVPGSPECYQLSVTDIEDREFSANTPELTSTGTTTSNVLPIGSFSAPDFIKFTNEISDPGLNYDPATGAFTVVSSGVYDLNVLIDINATFDPNTATSVKTICDVHGFINIYYTPYPSGPTVVADSLPFYITHTGGFSVGPRSTSSTPTYPDEDYMFTKAFGKLIQTDPIARGVNPPDRYQNSATGITLNAGDVINVGWRAGVFATSIFPTTYSSSNDLFEDSFGNFYDGDVTLDFPVGAFFNKVSNLSLTVGNNIQIEDVIPQKVKMIDYFMSNVKRFNLMIDISEDNPRELIVKTWDEYYSGGEVLNIHELIDISKEIKSMPMGGLDARTYYYGYKPDSDYWNARYTANWGEIYGERSIDVLADFANEEKKTEVIFSPTAMVGLPNNNRVLPTIYAVDENNQPKTTKFNIRSLYYAGLKPCLNSWTHIQYTGISGVVLQDVFTEYPYAGHFDDPFDPTIDINFGLVKEVFYDDDIDPIIVTNNNIVNKYHGKMIREITDKDSRIVEAYVHLKPTMYNRFTFNKTYYWNYSYFRLLSIEDYSPTANESTKCVFFKVKNPTTFTPTRPGVIGNPVPFDPNQSGGNVDMGEQLPAKGNRSFEQPNNNKYTSRTVEVNGESNYVNGRATNVEIYGDRNSVFAEADNIKIHGSDNIIEAGVKNVTLINTNGITVTDSDQTYINGINVTGSEQGGTYRPTLTDVTNLSASTSYECQYFRVGNVVTVSGMADADAVATGSTELGVSLPIPSTFTAIRQLSGTMTNGTNVQLGHVQADTVNNRAAIIYRAAVTTNQSLHFIFSYIIA